jgi:hypothetical protein
MTHPPDQVANALELRSRGLTATEVARRLGIPRAIVRDWFVGRTPTVASRPGGSCERCNGPAHVFGDLPEPYVYLLGLYLGDGCLSRHPRGVFKLRVTLDLAYPGIIEGCARAMRAVLPAGQATGKVTKNGCVDVYSY